MEEDSIFTTLADSGGVLSEKDLDLYELGPCNLTLSFCFSCALPTPCHVAMLKGVSFCAEKHGSHFGIGE